MPGLLSWAFFINEILVFPKELTLIVIKTPQLLTICENYTSILKNLTSSSFTAYK